MNEAEYRALPAINATAIAAGRISMKHMRHVMTGGSKKETPAMAWGRKVHAAILEPGRFFAGCAIWEGAKKSGGKWDAFKAEHKDGDLIVTPAEHVKLAAMSKAVWRTSEAAECLDGALMEQVGVWADDKLGSCKMRVDAWHKQRGILTDLKTTGQIDPQSFWRTAHNMGYQTKMGWYARGVQNAFGGAWPKVRLIVLEQDAPFDCWVCQIPESIVREGEEQAVETARLYRACEAAGTFPGAVDGMIDYELPGWLQNANTVDMEGIDNDREEI